MDRLDRAKAFARDYLAAFRDDDLTGLAAELAFRFFLALFPFVLFLVTLGAFIAGWTNTADPSNRVIELFGNSLPADAESVLRSQIDEVVAGASYSLLSISIVSALWAAAGGASALMKAVNRVYDLPEQRSFISRTAISLGLTVVGSVTLMAAVAAMMLTQAFGREIAEFFGLAAGYSLAVQILRLPVIVLFVMAAAETVYWLAPNRWKRPKVFSWGAAGFAVVWAIFTVGFAIYVANFGSYNATYGALGGVVILLFWFYGSSLLLLAGSEVNAVLESRRRHAPVAVSPAARGERPRTPHPKERALGIATLVGALGGLFAWYRGRGGAHG